MKKISCIIFVMYYDMYYSISDDYFKLNVKEVASE